MRRRRMSKKAGVPPPPTPKVPTPKQGALKEIYKKLVTANISNRIAALSEALDWWDEAQKHFMASNKLEPNQIKLMSQASKARNLAIGAGTDPEKEQAYLTTLKLVEKIWVKQGVLSHTEYYKRYEDNKSELERKEKAYADRFQAITEATDSAFNPLGLNFQVVKYTSSGDPREFDGENKVLISLAMAKALREKMKQEGVLPVLFSEANYAIRAYGIEKISDPDNPGSVKYASNMKKMLEAVPIALEGILKYLAQMPKGKIFRGYSGQLQATAQSSPVHVPKAHKVAANNGAVKQTRAHVSRGGNKVGGRYAPGSAMAELYLRLSDQKTHSISDIFKGLSVNNPNDRLRYLIKHGNRSGNWKIVQQGNSIQMILP